MPATVDDIKAGPLTEGIGSAAPSISSLVDMKVEGLIEDLVSVVVAANSEGTLKVSTE